MKGRYKNIQTWTVKLHHQVSMTVNYICKITNVSVSSFYRKL
ncbi:helix-turn-helix domain-containing protein [Peribacillus muralis]